MIKDNKIPEEQTVSRTDIINMDGHNWRVDLVKDGSVFAIRMDTPHTIRRFEAGDILDGLENGTYQKTEGMQRPPVSCPLSEDEGRTLEKRFTVIERLLEDEYPAWDKLTQRGGKKTAKQEAAKELGITGDCFNRILTRYLCSGRDRYSLLDGRRFNQTDAEVHKRLRASMGLKISDKEEPEKVERTCNGYTESEILQIGFQYFREYLNVQDALDSMNYDCYRVPIEKNGIITKGLIPPDQRPDYDRFYRYIKKRIGGRKISDYRKGVLNERNNLRENTGNTQTGVETTGQLFMMDECEVGIYLVDSETHSKNIGKPIVYIIIDAFSWMIVGCHIGFDNNSYAGFCNAFASMLEPHENQTSKYGIHCTEEEFPSMVLPDRIIADLGAEYRSKATENIMDPLGMDISFTPPGCGSLKGAVECTHRRLKRLLDSAAKNNGQISYGNGDDAHAPDKARKEAVITMETFKKMVYTAILELNKETLPGYEPNLGMLEAKLPLNPMAIWQYETNRVGTPKNISEEDVLPILYDLMWDDRVFTIGSNGIKCDKYNLFYRSDEDWFRRMQQDKGKNAKVRYDPEHIETVYVSYKNVIHAVPFADRHEELDDFKGLSWREYEELMKNTRTKEQKEEEYLRRITAKHDMREMVQEEKRIKNEESNETKHIKENRREEKRKIKGDPEDDKTRMENSGIADDDATEISTEDIGFVNSCIGNCLPIENGSIENGASEEETRNNEGESEKDSDDIDLLELADHLYD